jgi:hypothetical protein
MTNYKLGMPRHRHSGNIPLSTKHGVNPTLGVCAYCGKETGEIGLPGLLHTNTKQDVEAPRHMVLSLEPCGHCKERLKEYVMFVEVTARPPAGLEPTRTGNTFWLRDHLIEQMLNDGELKQHVLERRIAFILAEDAKKMGLYEAAQPNPGIVDNSKEESDDESNPKES